MAPSMARNYFFGKVLGFQYLIVQSGKFIEAALQHLAMVKFTFLNFYAALPYSAYQMTHHPHTNPENTENLSKNFF